METILINHLLLLLSKKMKQKKIEQKIAMLLKTVLINRLIRLVLGLKKIAPKMTLD
jgi:hypothetical protein